MSLRRLLPATASVVALLAFALAQVAAGAPSARLVASERACPGSRSSTLTAAQQRAALVCLVNHARRTVGLGGVRQSWKLSKVARAKGRDIVRCRDFSHTACGKPVDAKFGRLGYRYRFLGENLYAGQRPIGTAHDAFVAWLASPPHRDVIFQPRFSDAGVALFPLTEFRGTQHVRLWVLQLALRA